MLRGRRYRRAVMRRRLTAAVMTVLAIASLPMVADLPSAGALPARVVVEGKGWGHGRGLGQYGALGYAINFNWTYDRILQHYYSNTTAGTIGNDVIRIRLEEHNGRDTIVKSSSAFKVRNFAGGAAIADVPANGAALFRRVAAGTFEVFTGPGCGGPWLSRGRVEGSPGADPPTANPGNDATKMLQVCGPGGTRWYRGTIHAVDGAGVARTVNSVAIEDYLRGVVPRESPASWGSLGGGKGMQALKAQAVAARSYARSEARYTGYAETCDTISCQVYGGVQLQQGANIFILEHPLTDRAVGETAGQIRRMVNGSVARTEFSSSTGGYTAGGTFPAVVDQGDSISSNPNHRWSVTLETAAIAAKYPAIGTLTLIDVTKRNGLGEWGGRVQTVVLRGTKGSVTLSGNGFRAAFNLKSDWFNPINPFANNPAIGIRANFGTGGGYWIAGVDGAVFPFNGAPFHGDMGGKRLNAPVVGMAVPDAGDGYWLVGRDGGVFSFGLPFYGSTGNIRLNKPVVGMTAHPSGRGYWFVASDGGVFSYGASRFHGSMGDKHLNQPIVGMAATPSGNGYWLVARDGGIFSFGDAKFYGSTGSIRLNQPIVAMTATETGKGYWFVAADGGIFNYGDAEFLGAPAAKGVPAPVVDMARTKDGQGYWVVSSDGTTFVHGTAKL